MHTHEINPPAHPKNIGSNHHAALGLPPWLEYCGEYWGGGAKLVFTWPHFGQGENFDAKAVPQLPQNPPPDDNFIWEPQLVQNCVFSNTLLPQLVQVSAITNQLFNLS